jgi:hypothetical protein
VTATAQIHEVDPRTAPAWRELSESHPSSSLFNSPQWMRAIGDAYGFVPSARVLLENDVPVAGLSWTTIDDVRGVRRNSMPFSDWSDPFVRSSADWLLLSDGLIDPNGLPFVNRSRDVHLGALDPRLAASGGQVWHGTHIVEPEAQDAAFDGYVRRDISFARRAGLTPTVDYDWDSVLSFHRMHVTIRRSKYRMLAQPLVLFEALWHHFPLDARCVLNVRSSDGSVLASAVLFRWLDTVYFKFSASDQASLKLRPNDLLYRSVIAYAHDVGARNVDWGLSDADQPGLVRFKSKWSSTQRDLTTYRCGVVPPHAAEVGRLLGTVTDILTDPATPSDVVTRAGDELYRFFA